MSATDTRSAILLASRCTGARGYRPGRIPVEAIAELRRLVGTDFDGAAVEALIAALPRLVGDPVELDSAAFKWSPRARSA